MAIPKTKYDRFTYADYLCWDDEKRWEIVDGSAYDMTPAPGTKHQQVSGALFANIYNYLKGKHCQVFSAPFDVCLFENSEEDEDTYNVVQPDISVICDPGKIREKGVKGAPDWIIEVVSPTSVKYDFGTKLLLYQKYGVMEYWIVDPESRTINVYRIDQSGKYLPEGVYKDNDEISASIFPDLKIIPGEIFTI